MPLISFNYLYRDAGNSKAYGRICLNGPLSDDDRALIISKLCEERYFVAEQLGVPALYDQLYKWSDGPTKEDHCWHEFEAFEQLEDESEVNNNEIWGTTKDLKNRVLNINNWEGELSPHFALTG